MNDLPLPPMPEDALMFSEGYGPTYSAEQMQAYARAYGRMVQERCAALCDARVMGDGNREDEEAKRCAAAIRANKETP
jgi:hypothetical protein